MKKLTYFLSAALCLGMAACSSDDNTPDMPEPGPGPEMQNSYGAFIVNAGAQYYNIPGSLGYIEYNTGQTFDDLFSANNSGMTVGDIFNDGYVYGDRIYLAVTNSAVIHVLSDGDFKLEKQISFDSAKGGPRHITSYNGMIYATLFGTPGYLVEINPETLEVTREVEVGPLPEYVVAFDENLYVAVSDGTGDGSEACVAVVDPATFTVTSRIKGIINPVNLVTNGNQLFVCAWGRYQMEPPYAQYDYGVYEITGTTLSAKLFDATYICMKDDALYYFSAPYGEDKVVYGVYNTVSKVDSQWIDEKDGVDSPIAMAVDPVEGYVFLLSYEMGESGYPSYNTPGYARQYQPDGAIIRTFKAGVSPTNVFFNTHE